MATLTTLELTQRASALSRQAIGLLAPLIREEAFPEVRPYPNEHENADWLGVNRQGLVLRWRRMIGERFRCEAYVILGDDGAVGVVENTGSLTSVLRPHLSGVGMGPLPNDDILSTLCAALRVCAGLEAS